MKTNKLLILSVLCLFISGCKNNVKAETVSFEHTSVLLKDTLVKISSDWAILFLRYDEKMELWYDPYILDLNNNDTIKIENYNYENGSIPDIIVSPNAKYFVLDNIIKGYVETEEGKKLHENYKCTIIDLKAANSIIKMQQHCGGEWDNENNWVSGDEIIFHSK